MTSLFLIISLLVVFVISQKTENFFSKCLAYKLSADIFSILLISYTFVGDDGSARLMALTVALVASTAIYIQIYASLRKSIKKSKGSL